MKIPLKIYRDHFNTQLMQFVDTIIDSYIDGSYHFFDFKLKIYNAGNWYVIEGQLELRDDKIEIVKAGDECSEYSGCQAYFKESHRDNEIDMIVMPDNFVRPSRQELFEKMLDNRRSGKRDEYNIIKGCIL